jgi:hypothetical protein
MTQDRETYDFEYPRFVAHMSLSQKRSGNQHFKDPDVEEKISNT